MTDNFPEIGSEIKVFAGHFMGENEYWLGKVSGHIPEHTRIRAVIDVPIMVKERNRKTSKWRYEKKVAELKMLDGKWHPMFWEKE